MMDRITAQRRRRRWLGAAALAVLGIMGCVQLKEFSSPPAPAMGSEWQPLLDELRIFERRLGFRETRNFASLSSERDSYAFCGQASRLRLPYSYEDPAIRWLESITEEQCREVGSDTDAHFGSVEVWGEIGTPVTSTMISGTLDRFIYLVIHEDCHDQFELPYGIEEALCNIITYRAMAQFSSERFRWYTRENRAIKHYTHVQSRQTRETIEYYAQLESLYARYQRGELSLDALLKARADVFARAERTLELPQGELNNISMASLMTYSRHYPYLERVSNRFGSDIAGMIDFFRQVDQRKPPAAEILKRHRIADQKSVEFVRAYEAAVIETVGASLNRRTAALP